MVADLGVQQTPSRCESLLGCSKQFTWQYSLNRQEMKYLPQNKFSSCMHFAQFFHNIINVKVHVPVFIIHSL